MSIELNAAAIFETLQRHRVDYVLIGGFAARPHGATKPTSDGRDKDIAALPELLQLNQAPRATDT